MSGDWGWIDASQRVTPSDTGQTSAFWGKFFTNSSTGPSNKGTWGQLIASTPHDTDAILAEFRISDQAATALCDLGIGAAGAEQVLIPNLHLRRGGSNDITCLMYLPVRIPAGTRIAGCYSYDDGSNFVANVRARLHLLASTINMPSVQSRAATYGVNTSTSKGTAIDPGATAYTKSAWTQLTASTDFDANHLLLSIAEGGTSLTVAPSAGALFIDIAIGGAGAEQTIVQDYHVAVYTGIRVDHNRPGFPIAIPAGSRVAVRFASSDTSATTRPKEFSMTIFG